MTLSTQVIVNRLAGRPGDEHADAALAATLAASLGPVDITHCEAGDDVVSCARRAVDAGARLIVAVGGDGTIGSIAGIVAESDHAVLGVIPGGTFNHFAKDLGIPTDSDAAIRTLSTGRVIAVDLGEVNGRVFVNNSGLGLYPYMVEQRDERRERGMPKWIAAFVASVEALARYRLMRLYVVVDGVRLLRRAPAVFVGNNEYRFDVGAEPRRTTLRGGMLCLYIPRARRRLQLLFYSLRILFGRPGPDALDMILTDRFTIASRHRRLRVSLDGEVTSLSTPLEYRTRPGALRVLVPADAAELRDAPTVAPTA